jgi:hypothetical protein
MNDGEGFHWAVWLTASLVQILCALPFLWPAADPDAISGREAWAHARKVFCIQIRY